MQSLYIWSKTTWRGFMHNMDYHGNIKPVRQTVKISLNGLIVELKLNVDIFDNPDTLDKYNVILEAYKRMEICFDTKGFMWVKEVSDSAELVRLTYIKLTSILRNDYKEWCEDNNKTFINSEFKTAYDQVMYDVFMHTKEQYKNPEKSIAEGKLKLETMNSKKFL
jgi:hypothetical protein